MGNFVMGLSACAKACTPCALSSALLMGFDFKRNPPLKFPPRELAFHVTNTKPAVLWIGGLLQDGASVNQNSAGR